MLVGCNSCQKKFTLPDSAISDAGRLLQCGSCGNKWTQFPIKEITKKKPPEIKKQETNIKEKSKIKTSVKKKKREINLYSEEYLIKKHGLSIKGPAIKKQINQNSSNFFNYLIISFVFFGGLFGVLNLTKKFIVVNYPYAEPYINSLYEVIEILKTIIVNLVN
tara:strand:+ start:143 stop:631 length:489 start_codon:yes stop_codon:yes gene_type:complete